MGDSQKTGEQLLGELAGLRSRMAALEGEIRRRGIGNAAAGDVPAQASGMSHIGRDNGLYRAMFDYINSGVAVMTPVNDGVDFLLREFNRAAEKIARVRREDVIGRHLLQVFPQLDRTPLPEVFARVARTGEAERVAATYYRDDIREGWHENYVYRLPSGEVVSIFENVTQRVRSEQELRELLKTLEKTERLRSDIIDFLPDATFVIDLDGRVTIWNRAMEAMTGIKSEAMIGKGDYEYALAFYGYRRPLLADLVLNPDPSWAEQYAEFRSEADVWVVETEIPSGRGTEKRRFWAKARPLRDSEGHAVGAIESIRDITDRRCVEEALQENEEKFRLLAEETPVGISLMGADQRFEYFNQRFTEIFGYTLGEMPSKAAWFEKAYADVQYREKIRAFWQKNLYDKPVPGRIVEGTVHAGCKDGTEKIIYLRSVYMSNGKHLQTYEDITLQKKLEEQLVQARKMEAIGTLAGGIAHDFNNLLMGIQGYTSLMLYKLERSHPFYERLKGIEDQVVSGATLTRQMLGFARGGKYEVKPVDLNRLLEMTVDLFGRTRKEIAVHRKLDKRLWSVEADANQIEQVLLNLFLNAWQAMPGGGDLYLETQNVSLGAEYVKASGGPPGDYAKISVTDTGVGMDEKTRQRIFEPFFTTKEMGRGTGLGLASVYGIIKGHDGVINVYSEKGNGTTFNIYLPASKKAVETEVRPTRSVLKGTETLLIVDDEATILKVTGDLLQTLGYRVISASNGQEALELYRLHHGKIDLVLLDMVMPVRGGGEVYDELKKINPAVKAILSSGYSLNGEAKKILGRGVKVFIQKPFQIDRLSQVIREVLDAGEG